MRYWLPVLMYVALILALSAQPKLRPPLQFTLSDKFYHALEYFGLGVLLARAFRAGRRAAVPMRTVTRAVTLGVIVGACDEIFQSFVPGRLPDVYDVLADATGVLLAQLVFLLAVRE
jgi:VanZ family protein